MCPLLKYIIQCSNKKLRARARAQAQYLFIFLEEHVKRRRRRSAQLGVPVTLTSFTERPFSQFVGTATFLHAFLVVSVPSSAHLRVPSQRVRSCSCSEVKDGAASSPQGGAVETEDASKCGVQPHDLDRGRSRGRQEVGDFGHGREDGGEGLVAQPGARQGLGVGVVTRRQEHLDSRKPLPEFLGAEVGAEEDVFEPDEVRTSWFEESREWRRGLRETKGGQRRRSAHLEQGVIHGVL